MTDLATATEADLRQALARTMCICVESDKVSEQSLAISTPEYYFVLSAGVNSWTLSQEDIFELKELIKLHDLTEQPDDTEYT